MVALTGRDWAEVLECVRGMHDAVDLNTLAHRVIELLPRVVKCDRLAYNEVNVARRRLSAVVAPDVDSLEAFDAGWEQHQAEHPVLGHFLRHGDGAAHRVSDFLTRRQFRDTALYHDVYRPIECNFQISVTLPSRAGVVLAVVLNRRGRDFSDRDRAVLNLLRPHFHQAYLAAEAYTDLAANAARVNATLAALDDGLVAVAEGDAIAWASGRGLALLSRYFGGPPPARLPGVVAQWVARYRQVVAATRQPLVVTQADSTLVIRLLERAAAGEVILLLTERGGTPSPVPLQALGLTEREAEVLLLISRGLTNPRIAATLGCKPRTVQKHAEHIFRKLGVETRAAAAARALEVLGRAP